jgi:hypothetical protein
MLLVWKFKFAGAYVVEDGGDIILIRLPTGEKISVHLIESLMPLYELKSTMAYNNAAGVYTLFLLWCDLLLPNEGHVVEPYDWELALLSLYGECIYAYEIYGQEAFVFPVHFDYETPVYRHIRYGDVMNMTHLFCHTVQGSRVYLDGKWRVANFAAERRTYQKPTGDGSQYARPTAGLHPLAAFYDVLELSYDAGPEAVKIAYRRLARKYHPDLNAASDATERMQAINEAYQRILEELEGDT